jgi:hypothetical protein
MEDPSNGKDSKSNVLLISEVKPLQVEDEIKTRVNSCPKCGMEPLEDCLNGFRPVLRKCEIRGSWYLCENLKKRIAMGLTNPVSSDANKPPESESSTTTTSEDGKNKELIKK